MKTQTCPDRETLQQMLLGRIVPPRADELEQHLSQCDACASTADMMAAEDDWTEAIRAQRVLRGDEETIAVIIDRGQRLGVRMERGSAADTVSIAQGPDDGCRDETPTEPSRGNPRESEDERFDFLAPPQQPDELGRLGGYRVLEVLGVGGMGIVFRAEDPRLKRLVALKAMKTSIAASPSARERFLREAQATAAIEHDNIVTIHQVGEDGGVPFIAMQFLRGESLQTRLRREGPLEQREVVRIGREMVAGLVAAHARGLIHRDIKPDNIWLDGVSGRVKILDFGLARLTGDDAGLTQSGTVVGTPRYMAPEQALGEPVDSRCDLFSLGCVLYHLATGRAPFGGGNVTATLLAVVHDHPQAIETLCPGIDADLACLISRLLAKDRAARPQTAAEAAGALASIVAKSNTGLAESERPNAATEQPPSPARPAARLLRPFPVGMATAAVAIGLLIVLWATGVIFRVETPNGTLVVKASGDDFATTVQGQTVTIKNTQTNETFKVTLDQRETTQPDLKAGIYEFVLETASGLRTKTNRFTIEGGRQSEVEVWWEPRTDVVGDGKAGQDASATHDRGFRKGQSWHGWPADAPAPAIAPFDAAQARKHQQEWADYLKVPVKCKNKIGMKFAFIPPGEFMMGSTSEEIDAALLVINEIWRNQIRSEGPRHKVVLTQPFYLGMYEVTQAQYERVMGTNPSHFAASGPGKDVVAEMDTSTHPVEMVSWNDAAEFCVMLSEMQKLKPCYVRSGETVTLQEGDGYRLPTEAEWEFACRAGTATRYWVGERDEDLVQAGWFTNNSGGRTHAVGELQANPLGLFDMHGNVFECCSEWYAEDSYRAFAGAVAENPAGPHLGSNRVSRGGGWLFAAARCRSAHRISLQPSFRAFNVGFRVLIPSASQAW